MSLTELFLIGVGLSMDACAIAMCKGLSMKKLSLRHGCIIALYFGGFQALMPVIGWLLGKQFESYIVSVDHWVAFVLLCFIGGKMIYETIHDDNSSCCDFKLDHKELLVMAVATSIDALAVGITLAFLRVSIAAAASIIGVVTFVLSLAGVAIGFKFGSKFRKKAGILGGTMLCLMGLKILLEHLGIISF
ncbi:MAG: manganese efflux pump [Ruminococcaceae bacterium]|nr:manganese efflux pump [Oscillospiraceae bacterium]